MDAEFSQGAGKDRDPLRFARAVTRVMDEAFPIPGTRYRIGLDPLLGLFPGVGDAAGAIVTGYFVKLAAAHGAPPSVILRMLFNVGIDTLLGMVPLLGDIFDVAWKANIRNLALLERHLQAPGRVRAASVAVVGAAVVFLGAIIVGAVWVLIMAFTALAAALA